MVLRCALGASGAVCTPSLGQPKAMCEFLPAGGTAAFGVRVAKETLCELCTGKDREKAEAFSSLAVS